MTPPPQQEQPAPAARIPSTEEAATVASARGSSSSSNSSNNSDNGMDVVKPMLLEALPFPIGWQLVCDCLVTGDVLRLSAASKDCQRIARPLARSLGLRGGAPREAVAALVAQCSGLEVLRGVDLGVAGAERLALACEAHPESLARLRVLDLGGCMVGEQGLARLSPSLAAMPALEALLLDSNSLGKNQGTRALARALEGCGRLRVLSLASNGIGAEGGAELGCALIDSCRRLEILNLDGNLLGPSGITALARAFKTGACVSLRELHLRNSDVRREGLRELLWAFAAGACPSLSVFALDSNMFGQSGGHLLAQAFNLGACRELQVISLSATFLGDEGGEALRQALALRAWPKLRSLQLRHNYFRLAQTAVRLLDTLEARAAAGLPLQVLSLGTHDNLLPGAPGAGDVGVAAAAPPVVM